MLTNTESSIYYDDVESCVENTLDKVGKRIVLGTPIGLGKPNQLINEFFRRAVQDPTLELKIFTALTLTRPHWKNELERRLMEPLAARIFGNYPELDYVAALRNKTVPANIEIAEFYFQPGSFLNNHHAQQNYVSSNYTHVVRDSLDSGMNVFAQLISSPQQLENQIYHSLSCNPDLTPDLIPAMRAQERNGRKIAVLGQVNSELPFMYGDAIVPPKHFDAIVDHPQYNFKLFGPPEMAINPADYMIGLYASALIKDGGTIQLGIGSLGDAVTCLINMRHQHNDVYRSLLETSGTLDKFANIIQSVGETSAFHEGLYAVSEMFVDGFMQLYRSGVLRRKVYPHKTIQRLVNKNKISEPISPETLSCLIEEKIIHPQLTAEDVALLQQWGIFKAGLEYKDGLIYSPAGMEIPADLTDAHDAEKIHRHCLRTRLEGGHLLHASFFLGPQRFYNFLRYLDTEERKLFGMKRVSYVNQLYGDEELKRLQRKEARFLNSALMVTLNGGIVSDKLEDGRTVSGVGGQYNFVAMAHALADARSIIMLRSVREKHGKSQSNIIWNYGHTTIPCHLRDIVVTEYGIADLRGKNDQEIIIALINIADSRFQESLLKEAKKSGKIPPGYQIPEKFRNNYPERLKEYLHDYKTQGFLPEFPFGTDFTPEEIILMEMFKLLETMLAKKRFSLPDKNQLKALMAAPESATPYLQRLQLDRPRTMTEQLMQKLVLYGLLQTGAI